jgi:predicted nucleotidyltransferase
MRFEMSVLPDLLLEGAPPPPLPELAAAQRLRLDGEEIRAIEHALQGIAAPVYLFGSRAESARRGGDIDLLVLTDAPGFETSRRVATRFFARCEEKIDVIVLDPARLSPAQRAFLEGIHAVRIR